VKQSRLPNAEIASAEYGLAMTGRTIAAEGRRTMTGRTIAAEGRRTMAGATIAAKYGHARAAPGAIYLSS